MKKNLSLCIALLLAVSAFAQTLVTGPSAPRLTSVDYDRLKRIDTLCAEYVKNGWEKGIVTIVVKDGVVVQQKGYGWLDEESGKAMPADALFRIASQTKAITSVGLMMLWEEGRFTLDEPISDFMSEFHNPKVLDKFNAADSTYTTVPAKREVTFRDLLTHSSGIEYAEIGSPAFSAIYAKAGLRAGLGVIDLDLKTAMRKVGTLPLAHQPGEKFTYGLNLDVAGALIELMSGLSLEEFLTRKIFLPLGMRDTYFNVPESKAGRLTTVYTEDSAHHIIRWGKTFRNIDPAYPLAHKTYFAGGAGLTSTAFDYAVFLQMLLNGGVYNHARILAPRTVKMMTSMQNHLNPDPGGDNFGLAFQITGATSAARGPKNAGSFAWGGYFGTNYWADPVARLACLVLTQLTPASHGGNLGAKFEQLVYQSLR